MAKVFDNWERLVGATLRREQLRLTGLRTPSDVSSVSLSSVPPSFNFSSKSRQISSFNFWSVLVGDSFTYHQILKATDFLSDSNLIKHGHSGDLYYGFLESGIQMAVKKINLSSVDSELHFMSELEICGMVNHSRLIPFLGYCLENVHEKFLVYKYTPDKDLSSHLQMEIVSDADGNRRVSSLDWITRLKIATGAAEGLCYLHHECFPPLVHRDIQASSILLDDDFEVRLGSLTEVCIQEKDDKQKSIERFLRLPKGFVKSTSGTSNASCAYDVYCFGKVLLELVSGKLGISSVNDSTMKDWMANTLQYVVPDNKKLVLKIVDPFLLIDEHVLVEVWLVAFVAKACLISKPSKRPEMAEILKVLEYTESASFSTHGNVHPTGHPNSVSAAPPMDKCSSDWTKVPEGTKLMGWILQVMTNTTSLGSSTSSGNDGFSELPNGKILASPSERIFTYSELQNATKYFGVLRELLGEGEFGRVYKGLINEKSKSKSVSKSVVAVKKFHSHATRMYRYPCTRMQRSQDWQEVVNHLRRVSHPNVVKLLGCCLEDKEQLFVYEFMQRGSLDCHLFRMGSAVQPLSWDIRLKILIGAARGLEFLHALQGQGFFHPKNKTDGLYGVFKPSKILLDDDYNAKISGFVVGEIDLPDIHCEAYPLIRASDRYAFKKFETDKYVYVDPEYHLTGHICLKSDVYGFGVVLVQMLTGKEVCYPGLRNFSLEFFNLGYCYTYRWLDFETSRIRKELEMIMDPGLKGKYPSEPAIKMVNLAISCVQDQSRYRPSMKQVVNILEHIESADEVRKRTSYKLDGKTDSGNNQ